MKDKTFKQIISLKSDKSAGFFDDNSESRSGANIFHHKTVVIVVGDFTKKMRGAQKRVKKL